MRILVILAGMLILALQSGAAQEKSKIVTDFEPVCRTLDTLIHSRTTVMGELGLRNVMRRGNYLDFYFTNSLSDLPWTHADYVWFMKELEKRFPPEYRRYSLGRVSSRGEKIQDLVTGVPDAGGFPTVDTYRLKKRVPEGNPIVERVGDLEYPDGLDGRHIALWQSHGLYYEQAHGRWEWQRPCLFQTVEDLFTQSYVLPFLVPMLENAGAYVMLPRERDIQVHEVIVDNDPDFRSDSSFNMNTAPEFLRKTGTYTESGKWEDAGTGFADAKETYTGLDNPFGMGTARMAECTDRESGRSEAVWIPEIPERGEYAVYVSYRTLKNSSDAAHYTVRHLGGETEFLVNQTMGGGTWVYLGTFEFAEGYEGRVTLDNMTARSGKRKVVTADAVKIGGGYGNIARSIEGDAFSVPEISGMPRFTEGARYWLQWAGIDSTIFSQNNLEDDYKDDFMCRGDWVAYMSGGSHVNPKEEGRNIPFDLSFALHSDAGTTPNDSTIGTLAIYTLKSEYKRKLPSGEDRRTSREFANLVQSQIVQDIREEFDPEWNRRFIWDRSYRESRTPTCPSMLCELLSHQNFADMKYGLDPSFRFTVSRAVYKGMLKYLSNRYGCDYAVQPLPVNSLSATFVGDKIRLKWMATPDRLEPTADATGFLLQTRVDDGAFDSGKTINAGRLPDGKYFTDIDFIPGHLYSFRIIAFNSGGKSFPSETMSAGVPAGALSERISDTDSCILVVNNFDRVSGPAWFDSPEFAGFDNRVDGGVPYMREIAFTGEMYQNSREALWQNNANPGFGASYSHMAGSVIAGNTFDYPSVHGKAILDAGYPFCSSSADAFCHDTTLVAGIWCMDLICGKQARVPSKGDMPDRYGVFGREMRDALERFTVMGGNLLVSGANIGTDIWDRIYPVAIDSLERAEGISFAEKVLGFSYVSNYAGRTGEVMTVPARVTPGCTGERFRFNTAPDARIYSVEAPDGIIPSSENGCTFMRYGDTRVSAGICSDFGTYRTVCIGFPIETITERIYLDKVIKSVIGYLKGRGSDEQ